MPGARLVLQDDHNVVLYIGDKGRVELQDRHRQTDRAGSVERGSGPAPKRPPPSSRATPCGAIAEKFLGDGNRYPEIAKLNNIANRI